MSKRRVGVAVVAVLLGAAGWGAVWAEEPVSIPDVVLKDAIERALWVYDPTPSDMLSLTSLTCTQTFATQDAGIRDLTGLSSAANLQSLNLRLNWIGSVSDLSSLSNLESLNLSQNRISDLSPLSGLTSLRYLNVHGNKITDLSAVSSLINLEDLNIRINEISDLSPLSGLTALTDLDAKYAEISDLSPLSGLTNLQYLTLPYNKIDSVAPLSGLDALAYIDLQNNKISDVSPLAGLPNLRVVDLRDNELNEDAYRTDLEAIVDGGVSVGIKYDPNPRTPTGVQASDGTHRDSVLISWDELPNGPHYTTFYRVARVESYGPRQIISDWQTAGEFEDVTAEFETHYSYSVQAATSGGGENESAFSSSDTGWRPFQPALLLSSTAGGAVTLPGEGTHAYSMSMTVAVIATPVDPTRYVFAGFTGTAVEAGKVTDPCKASTTVLVDAAHTLRAHFLTTMETLYVDNATPGDFEDGTADAPFDTIQEAIDVAPDGVTIVVRPGTYRENIDLGGRNLHLTGIDAEAPLETPLPVIDGGAVGPVVRFTQGEDPNCLLAGFVLTGGRDPQAGAILFSDASPTLLNCLIVGNRTTGPEGATITCIDSDALFSNCTIADNEGVGVRILSGDVSLVNSIVWNNKGGAVSEAGHAAISIRYCDIEGGWSGPGNLDANPFFVRSGRWADPDHPHFYLSPSDSRAVWIAGDYHLRSEAGRWDAETQMMVYDNVTSPCIGAAEPSGTDAPIDLGAYGY